MRTDVLSHEFVDFIPAQVDEGVLYISVTYTTAVHRCACGCGQKVVTPLSPTDWSLLFDGVAVSLSPSIGNWSFPCQSHYWIRRNTIDWAPAWSREAIAAGRTADLGQKSEYFSEPVVTAEQLARSRQPLVKKWLRRLRRLVGR